MTTSTLTAASDWALQRFIDRGHPNADEFRAELRRRAGLDLNPLARDITALLRDGYGLDVAEGHVRDALPEFVAQVRKNAAVTR
jgi:ribose 1,5-bisphosphokinase PhnN